MSHRLTSCFHGIICAKISKGKQPRSCKSYIRMGKLQGKLQVCGEHLLFLLICLFFSLLLFSSLFLVASELNISEWLNDVGGIGKQVVYHTLQKVSDDTNTNSIDKVTTEIKTLQEELSSIKAEEKTARSSLSTLKSKPRISELHLDIQRLEKEQIDLQTKLTKSTASSDTIKLTPEQRATLESEWKYWQRQATLRRRICRDLWGRCSEVLPENITASELWVCLHSTYTTRCPVPVARCLRGRGAYTDVVLAGVFGAWRGDLIQLDEVGYGS